MSIFNTALELAAKTLLVISSVDQPTKEFRRGQCSTCEFRDAATDRCKICKCFLAVKTGTAENLNPIKGRYEITHCPKGRWNDLDVANAYRKIDGLPSL